MINTKPAEQVEEPVVEPVVSEPETQVFPEGMGTCTRCEGGLVPVGIHGKFAICPNCSGTAVAPVEVEPIVLTDK